MVRTDAWLLYDSAPSRGDAATKETGLIQWSRLVDGDHGYVGDNGILRECGGTHLRKPVSKDECQMNY